MSEKIIGGLNVNDIIKYLITGIWAYFVLYLVTDGAYFPKESINAFMGILIVFSFGALSYHSFRSTLFIVITLIGDLFPAYLCENHRLEDARNDRGIERGIFRARFYLCAHWAWLNDNRRIEREMIENKSIKSNLYDLWLSSIITMYLCGIFTIIITILFYNCEKTILPFKPNDYYWIGGFLLFSAFISQRLYEKRILRHFRRVLYNSRKS